MTVPFFHRLLPKNDAVKRIARHERPARRQLDGHARAFVHHIKYAPARRHQRAHARHPVVVARPARTAEPLQMPRRPHHRVMRHRVAAGVVQVVRPVVDVFRPRLGRRLPFAATLYIGNPLRREHPHHLRHRHALQVLGHQQVHHVVNVRQRVARKAVDGNRAIHARRLHRRARFCHVGRIGVEPVHKKPVVRPQRKCEFPIATTEVHDEAAFEVERLRDARRGVSCGK